MIKLLTNLFTYLFGTKREKRAMNPRDTKKTNVSNLLHAINKLSRELVDSGNADDLDPMAIINGVILAVEMTGIDSNNKEHIDAVLKQASEPLIVSRESTIAKEVESEGVDSKELRAKGFYVIPGGKSTH